MSDEKLLDDRSHTWTCRIGSRAGVCIPPGADGPMRDAVYKAFKEVTTEDAEACFSGWGDQFTEEQLAVIENRLPLSDRTEYAMRKDAARWRWLTGGTHDYVVCPYDCVADDCEQAIVAERELDKFADAEIAKEKGDE